MITIPPASMRRAAWLALLLALGGCTPYAAWNGAGMWQPSGANAANLRAMLAAPHDLVAGRGTDIATGAEATPPIEALDSATPVGTTSSGAASGGAYATTPTAAAAP